MPGFETLRVCSFRSAQHVHDSMKRALLSEKTLEKRHERSLAQYRPVSGGLKPLT